MPASRSARTANPAKHLRFLARVEQFRIANQCDHGLAQRFARIFFIFPADTAEAIRVQPDHGDIPLPAAVASCKFELYLVAPESHAFHGKFRDFLHGDVIARRYVVGLKFPNGFFMRGEHASDDIFDVNVGLTLSSITQNAQPRGILAQGAYKIEADAMRLPRSDDVSETENTTRQIKHVTIRTDERL